MNDLIKFENGQLAQETINYIELKETQMKTLKKEYEEFKEELLNAMEQNGVIKVDTDKVLVSYIAPTTSERFDSKSFKEDNPTIYDSYVKISPVKASVKVTLRKK